MKYKQQFTALVAQFRALQQQVWALGQSLSSGAGGSVTINQAGIIAAQAISNITAAGAIVAGLESSTTFQAILCNDSGSDYTATGATVTVRNRDPNMAAAASTGTPLVCFLMQRPDGVYFLVSLGC